MTSQHLGEVNSHITSTTTPTDRISPPKMGRVGCHDPYSPKVLRGGKEASDTIQRESEAARKANIAELAPSSGPPVAWSPKLPQFIHAHSLSVAQHFHQAPPSLTLAPMTIPGTQQHQASLYPPPAYISFASNTPVGSLTHNVHHNALSEVCTFVSIPAGRREVVVAEDSKALAELLRTHAAPPRPLFVGQCRFELSAGELHWLLEHLLGVCALKIEPRGPGCFVVVLRDEESSNKVLQLHRCVLFDHDGVWWADTAAAQQHLEAYVRDFLSGHYTRRSRLPRDTMIVERQRGSLNPLRTVTSATNAVNHFPMRYHAGGEASMEAPRHNASSLPTSGMSTPAEQHQLHFHQQRQILHVGSVASSIGSSPSNSTSFQDSFHND
jgi:hypothetical protein